ncbi:26S proteasome regulatory subunit 6A [Tanacetum coccineum]
MLTDMMEDTNIEDDDLASMTIEDIKRQSHLLDNEIRLFKEELQRTNLELDSFKDKIKENPEKIKLNKLLPYLVGNIVEKCFLGHEESSSPKYRNAGVGEQLCLCLQQRKR